MAHRDFIYRNLQQPLVIICNAGSRRNTGLAYTLGSQILFLK